MLGIVGTLAREPVAFRRESEKMRILSRSFTQWNASNAKLANAKCMVEGWEVAAQIKDEAGAVLAHAFETAERCDLDFAFGDTLRMAAEASRYAAIAQAAEEAVTKIVKMTSKADAQDEMGRAIARIDQAAVHAVQ